MEKQVIHIYGASGSGTSTVGRFIGNKLGYFFMDTDNYFWEPTVPPYTTKRSVDDRIALMRKDLAEHGGADMRSKSKHDRWQKRLQCRQILLDGSLPVEKNFEIVRKALSIPAY